MHKKIRNEKEHKRQRRHMHIRNHVVGTAERPRVAVFRSCKHIYAQIVDDSTGRTLATVSSLKLDSTPAKSKKGAKAAADAGDEAEGKKKKTKAKEKTAVVGAKVLQAREVGRMLAEVAKEKGITKIAFDRGGYLYHGRVAALAEAAREHGLDF